jgi:hypothetical protein
MRALLRAALGSAINRVSFGGLIVKRFAIAVVAAVLPMAAFAAVSTTALLSRVPGMPHDAASAYAQWIDTRGDLTPGPAFKALDADIHNTMLAPLAGQRAGINLMEKYNTPAGQAELRNMTTAQKIALGQQIQAQMGYAQPQMGATAVSDHDQALMRRITTNPNVGATQLKLAQLDQQLAPLETGWSADEKKIDAAQQAELNKLPICKSEAGEPSQASVKAVMFKYADQRAGLASAWLAKYQGLENQMRGVAVSEAKYADDTFTAWSQIQNPMIRSQTQPITIGAIDHAAADASVVLNVVETGSKLAAQTIAKKKHLEIQFANAKGC